MTLPPGGQILGDLRHFDIGIELFDLIENGVFIVVTKVIKRLLLSRKMSGGYKAGEGKHAFGF